MPRLFTALEVPLSIRTHLALLRSPLGGAKWVEAEHMHITLRFAGDVDERTADEFAAALARVRAEPIGIAIRNAGAFGGRDPRVLWAGVEGGEALEALYRAHERAARSAGLERDRRGFKPHVTLARMRGAKHRAVARFLQENSGLRTEPFVAERFVLFSARPGAGGGPYAVEAEYPLLRGGARADHGRYA